MFNPKIEGTKKIVLNQSEIHYVDKPDERGKILIIKELKKEKIEKYMKFLHELSKKNIDRELGFPFLVSRLVKHVSLIEAIKIAKIYRKHVQGVEMDW